MSQIEFLCWIIGAGVVSGTIGAMLHTYVEYILTNMRAEREDRKATSRFVAGAVLVVLAFAGMTTPAMAQENGTVVTVVGTVTADGGKQTPIATATPGAPQSGSRVISTRFIGREIVDCPRFSLCPTAEQAVGALTIEGNIFGIDLTPQQEADLRGFLKVLSPDQAQDLWNLAPNLGATIDGEELIQISRIISSRARHQTDVALIKAILGIAFPPTPAPTWAGNAPTVTHIMVLD